MVRNLILINSCEFYYDDITVTSFVNVIFELIIIILILIVIILIMSITSEHKADLDVILNLMGTFLPKDTCLVTFL